MTVGDWEDLAITLAVALNRSIDRHQALVRFINARDNALRGTAP
jgi:hypothetical protein